MDKNAFGTELKFVSGVLSDIETIDLPWSEFNLVSICYDWDTAIIRLKELSSFSMNAEQKHDYESVLERIRAQKEKIAELQYTYPDFIDL